MTTERLKELFSQMEDTDYLDYKNLDPSYRKTSYADLDAFLLLDRLVPSDPIDHMPGRRHDMVSCAEHDEIWLRVDLDKLAAAASELDIRTLQQLGVRLDRSSDGLAMFV